MIAILVDTEPISKIFFLLKHALYFTLNVIEFLMNLRQTTICARTRKFRISLLLLSVSNCSGISMRDYPDKRLPMHFL